MRRTAVIIATFATVAIAACGDDDADTSRTSTTPTVAAAAPDPDRYCALTRELEAGGEKVFASLGEDARPEEYEAAERRFITRFAGQLEELEQVAPREIERDVATLLAGQRRRAGLPATTTVSEAEGSAAETRILAWEKRNCDS